MKKIFFFIAIFIFLFSSIQIFAYELSSDSKIYVSGSTIGIKLETGVCIVGTFGVNSNSKVICPWENANIKDGDIITKFNEENVTTTSSLLSLLKLNKDNIASINVKRGNADIKSNIKPVLNDKNEYSLGLLVKDHMLGVGTLTYLIPNENIYGALGHSITDLNSYGGNIYEASVNSIKKPSRQEAGEKKASIISASIGNIEKNSETGIHGVINQTTNNLDLKLMNIGLRDDVHLGKASILTTLDGTKVEEFEIEIIDCIKQDTKSIKGIKFKVTDEKLIKASGGIVQGMSGSPIIQDGKIIGAVTHVLLSDAKVAYGIYIEFMLQDMDIFIVE